MQMTQILHFHILRVQQDDFGSRQKLFRKFVGQCLLAALSLIITMFRLSQKVLGQHWDIGTSRAPDFHQLFLRRFNA